MFDLKVDLLKGNIFKSLIIFSIPILISNIFQQMYNTMDTTIVGTYLGSLSLASMGACSAIYDLLIGFALGVGDGISIIIARSYGLNDEELLKRSIAHSIIVGVFITGLIMLISKLCLLDLLKILNTPTELIQESYSYISIITSFVGIMFTYNLCSGILRAVGNSIIPLISLIISSMINIVLDILFITQFNMGIKGAAIATVISQGISIVLCFLYMYKRCPTLIPEKRHFVPDKNLYIELLGQGFSMGLMMSIVCAGTVILQFSINNLGYLVIAGHTATRKVFSFCIMPFFTMASSLSTFVSQNKGANNMKRIRESIRYANIAVLLWSVLILIILKLFSCELIRIISVSSENVIIENGSRYLIISAYFFPVLGIVLNVRNALQGFGQKVVTLVSSFIELFGKILFATLFVPSMGYFGVSVCEPIIWCCMCIPLIYSFYYNIHMKYKAKKIEISG